MNFLKVAFLLTAAVFSTHLFSQTITIDQKSFYINYRVNGMKISGSNLKCDTIKVTKGKKVTAVYGIDSNLITYLVKYYKNGQLSLEVHNFQNRIVQIRYSIGKDGNQVSTNTIYYDSSNCFSRMTYKQIPYKKRFGDNSYGEAYFYGKGYELLYSITYSNNQPHTIRFFKDNSEWSQLKFNEDGILTFVAIWDLPAYITRDIQLQNIVQWLDDELGSCSENVKSMLAQ